MFKTMKRTAIAAALGGLVAFTPAHADYLFSGVGTSGNLTPGAEAWAFNFTFDPATGNNWGSPGVGAGVTPYSRPDAAYGFDITFTGGSGFAAGSIATGNASACIGTTSGGTTFCTVGATNNIWIATEIDDNTIAFRAQDPSFFITSGQNYFVNIFFAGDAPRSFTGRWLTEFSPNPVPAPATTALLGLALVALALTRRKAA